jgi:hypothetical protein
LHLLGCLGVRAVAGRGLLGYLYYSLKDGLGVLGYDPIQGALAPALRISCHTSFVLMLWAGVLYGYDCFRNLNLEQVTIIFYISCLGTALCGLLCYYGYCFTSTGTALFGVDASAEVKRWGVGAFFHAPALLLGLGAVMYGYHSFKFAGFFSLLAYSGNLAAILYGLGCFYVFHVMPGVSVPGGPRPHKIQRHPQWEDKNWEVLEQSRQHRYVTADESHYVSEGLFAGTCAVISGEPAGRDMWTTETKSVPFTDKKANRKVDEALVRRMASGGRSYSGFNPHHNPNR